MDNEPQQQVVSSLESHQNGSESSENNLEVREKRVHHNLLASQHGNDSNFHGFFGKHRLQAAISHLNNQINITQEELTQLEIIGESSIVCKDVISTVESIPDPLLSWIKSFDANWDRWFGGAHNSRNKRWI